MDAEQKILVLQGQVDSLEKEKNSLKNEVVDLKRYVLTIMLSPCKLKMSTALSLVYSESKYGLRTSVYGSHYYSTVWC